ncbi:hypothetical protein C9374_004250 [Naegleria lovaniensis]|uniref:Uncharacterized protein n=1 Tax=Naegleria lovaniensis TaxID=51637 RepID=A0AA88GM83_NAELO|nr:uncharacterized protein C9374_004250 [Naegleria lovaniensis]KAG2383579.1 hypothetical protein C9374_004250 [Naegleria lovaniensis]
MNFLSYHHDQQQPKTKQQHQVPPLTVPHNALVYGKPLSSSSVPSQQQLVFDPKILANTTQQGSLRTSPSSSSFNVPSSSLAQIRSSTPPLEASRLSSAFNLYSRPLNATAQPQTPSWRAELVEETMEDLLMEGYSRFRSIEEFNINMLLTNLSSNCIEVKQQNPLSTYQSLSGLNKPSLTSGDPWLHQPQQVVTTPMPTSIENSSSDTNSFTQLLLGNNIPTSCSSLLSKPTPRVQLLPPAALPSHTGSNEIESTKVASSSSPPQNTKPKVTKTKEKKKRPTKSKKENSENDPTAPPKEKKRKSSQFSSSLINFQATKAKKDVQFHNYNPPNINTE